MTIDDIIREFKALKAKHGGKKIVKVSSDEEGNMISDIFEIVLTEDEGEEVLVIYPNQ